MKFFHVRGNAWWVEGVPLSEIAEKVGTPAYVYSLSAVEARFRELQKAFRPVSHLIMYSMKSNGNLTLLKRLAELGAGVDVVSGGELYRARRAGVPADRIAFAGVGKTREEMRYALKEGIRLFNVESLPEMEVLEEEAEKMHRRPSIGVRFNPDVDPQTHHYITTGKRETKFGIPIEDWPKVVAASRRMRFVRWNAVQCHIGSQMLKTTPLKIAARRIEKLVALLRKEGIPITTVDFGGGFGVRYHQEKPPSAAAWAKVVLPVIRRLKAQLVLEPGRFLSANAGVLLTRVLYVKHSHKKTFVIVDAGMGELIRPALYEAYHEIAPVKKTRSLRRRVDVVGPICESGDFFAKERLLPLPKAGDLLAVFSAGAYGAVMGTTYNARPIPPEVVVRGRRFATARPRRSVSEWTRGERVLVF